MNNNHEMFSDEETKRPKLRERYRIFCEQRNMEQNTSSWQFFLQADIINKYSAKVGEITLNKTQGDMFNNDQEELPMR